MLSSVTLPSSSYSALAALRSINRDLETTQTRLATGKKVNSASDNPAVWSMAKGLEGENRTSAAVRSGLDVAASRADNASKSLGKAVDLLTDLKSKMVEALAPGADRAAIGEDIKGIQASLKSLVAGGNMGGTNWLSGGGSAAVVIGSDASSLLTSTVNLAGSNLIDADGTGKLEAAGAKSGSSILSMTAPLALGEGENKATDIETVISGLKSAAASFGSTAKRFEGQATFLKTIETIRASTISDLTDADMDEETARLAALQVRQDLASTALQIANASMRNILKLFQ